MPVLSMLLQCPLMLPVGKAGNLSHGPSLCFSIACRAAGRWRTLHSLVDCAMQLPTLGLLEGFALIGCMLGRLRVPGYCCVQVPSMTVGGALTGFIQAKL